MNAASITTATFRLLAEASAAIVHKLVTVVEAGALPIFTPSSPLVQGTVYTATVTAAVTDAIGTPLGADSLWSFTTNVAPTVTVQAPAPGATGVPLNTTVTASLSKAMNADPLTPATFRLRPPRGTADSPATLPFNAAGTLFFFNDTATTEIYTLSLHDALPILTDAIGTPLGADSLWSFTTNVPPTVTAQAPAPGATGVPLNTTVTASFSKAMNEIGRATCRVRVQISGGAASLKAKVTVNAAGTVATLTPSSPLGAGTVYTATVAGSVTDAIGTPLGADSLWSFTTDVAPTVTAQAPAPGATGVPLNTTVTASFSKAMNAATITTATFRLRAAGSTADVPAMVTVNAAGTLATLTPSSPLVQGTVYTATVTAAVTDAIGTPLGADSLWSFTTDVAPTVTAQAPTPNATGLAISTTVTVTFSKAMNAASITTATFRLRAAGSTADVPATVTVNAAEAGGAGTASRPRVQRKDYTTTVTAAVTDAIGTPLGADSLWSFTTNVAPTVTVQAPAPGATGVPLNTTVTASFSKAMNAATITTATFRLRAAGSTADVPATVTVNAAGTLATLTPSSPLGAGTVYTATVTAAVTDAIGTPLGADSLWSFTTDVAPTVTAQAPAPGATGVPPNTSVTRPFSRAMNAATTTPSRSRLRAAGSTADVPATVTVNAA